MNRKLIPIKTIIKKVEELAENPKTNNNLLLKYSKLLEDQNKIVSKISTNKIKNKLNTDLSFEQYCKYKDLLEEKKMYDKYEETINNIINKNYKAVKLNRTIRRRKLSAGIATGVVLLSIASIGYVSLMKGRKNNNNNDNNTSITTETTTEATTEGYRFVEEENNDDKNSKELVYEKDEDSLPKTKTTEKQTETTTETTTEKTTEATTEKTTITTTEATTKQEPTTTTIVFQGQEQLENPYIEEDYLEELSEEQPEEIFINDPITEEPTTEKITEEKTTEKQTETTTEATTEKTTQATTETTTQNNTDTIIITDDNNYVEFEDDVIDLNKFENLKDFYYKASEYINVMEDTLVDKDKRDNAREMAKQKVVDYVDFIFYGKEIDGVTFNDLKEDEKQKTYEILQKLDNEISKDDPDYKERFGERYNRVKDFGSTTLDNAKNKIKEKVGDDYYDQAGTVKDDTIDSIKDTGKILKNIFNDMYQKWKNKDN